jgi:hypothetical protein
MKKRVSNLFLVYSHTGETIPLLSPCPICLDEIQVNPFICEPCQHTFCGDCISTWMHDRGESTCPVDRQAIDLVVPNTLMKKTLQGLLLEQEIGRHVVFSPEGISSYKHRIDDTRSSSSTISSMTERIDIRGMSVDNPICIELPSTSSLRQMTERIDIRGMSVENPICIELPSTSSLRQRRSSSSFERTTAVSTTSSTTTSDMINIG